MGERIHRNRPLRELTVHAREVLAAVLARTELVAAATKVSVDTWKAPVAKAALAAGARLISVSGLRDPEIADLPAAD